MQRSRGGRFLLLLLSLTLCYFVEWTASVFTQSSVSTWYLELEKPSWTPPNIAFPIVWTALYTLIGISFWYILCLKKAHQFKVFGAFFLQLFANFMWSFSFFYLQSPELGLVNILLLDLAILCNIYVFVEFSQKAAKLLFPYLLWVLYATTLNLGIVILN